MGKWTDKNYITRSEWSYGFGGGVNAMKNKKPSEKYQKTSFNLCSLSLLPFTHPVCTSDGVVYELENILPYVQKYGKNPLTGNEMSPSDLIRLIYHKNGSNEYFCPITLNTFTDFSHIVANRKTGNVYSYDAHLFVNPRGTTQWKDPISEDLIKKTDLITIHDPTRSSKTIHLNSNLNDNTDISTISNVEIKKLSQISSNPPSSLTKSTVCLIRKDLEIFSSESDERLLDIKEKGFVTFHTNLGFLQAEIYCDKAPKASYNFLTLCARNEYDNISFCQKGNGVLQHTPFNCNSIWNRPFKDEALQSLPINSRGFLCLNNTGPNTNTSQFFISLGPCPHLSGKHTVFGKIVKGIEILTKVNSYPCDKKSGKLITPLSVSKIEVIRNPFPGENNTKTEIAEIKLPSAFDYY